MRGEAPDPQQLAVSVTMGGIYRYRGSDLSYEFKMIPKVEAAIVSISNTERRAVIIPGIGWSAEVEILLFKDEHSLTRNLSELGECFVVDSFTAIPDSRIAGKLRVSILSKTDWDITKVYYAVPLEMVKGGMYRMASFNVGPALFTCSSSTLFDSEVGSSNCLEACLFQIDYLMGGCKLGVPQCSEGLHEYVSTNKETASEQLEDEY